VVMPIATLLAGDRRRWWPSLALAETTRCRFEPAAQLQAWVATVNSTPERQRARPASGQYSTHDHADVHHQPAGAQRRHAEVPLAAADQAERSWRRRGKPSPIGVRAAGDQRLRGQERSTSSLGEACQAQAKEAERLVGFADREMADSTAAQGELGVRLRIRGRHQQGGNGVDTDEPAGGFPTHTPEGPAVRATSKAQRPGGQGRGRGSHSTASQARSKKPTGFNQSCPLTPASATCPGAHHPGQSPADQQNRAQARQERSHRSLDPQARTENEDHSGSKEKISRTA